MSRFVAFAVCASTFAGFYYMLDMASRATTGRGFVLLRLLGVS